ncbi:MAG: hypothetical protein ER33_12540 [Cyanobium sp. CACIAM 14]|nr:MAG: hypothetical protein ER33_12540 [Cyanobium sp. CACIAM 14]
MRAPFDPLLSPARQSLGRGFWLGMLIFLGWLISLLGLLLVDLARWPPLLPLLAVALRTFLQTGLFIVGHDAMHRTLVPGRRDLNDRLGRLALQCYAALPYGPCRRHHLRHHRCPGTGRDPDFRSPSGQGLVLWYLRFMGRYLSAAQLIRLLLVWGSAAVALACLDPLRILNLPLFWILPLVLSSLQLFLFGTYLPHRPDGLSSEAAGDPVAGVRSLPYRPFLSLLACYHFGYHREHHAYPSVPWFLLPRVRRLLMFRHGPEERLAPASGRALVSKLVW